MDPGQRVGAIRRLTAAMVDWSYSEIDLVFKQFGVPWSDSWGGDTKSYLLQFLGEANDSALTALQEYLGGNGSDNGAAPVQSTVWSGDLFRLFLSHSSVDKIFVSELKKELRRYGIEGFVAHEDIDPSAEWLPTILGALDTCDSLAAVLTEDFRQSNWCDQEVGHCIGMRKLIIPLALGCLPYGFMGRYQALKCKEAGPGEIARQITDVLIDKPLTSARMAEALVANLERSGSFAEAKANMTLVRRIRNWTPGLLRKLEGCLKNYQVSNSFGVPGAIQTILNQYSGRAPEEDPRF